MILGGSILNEIDDLLCEWAHIFLPIVPDDQSPLASGMSPARKADQQETCQKSRRDGDLVDRSVRILICLIRFLSS